MKIDCREFPTNVPEAGDAAPADTHQGGGFVRIANDLAWQFDIDAGCHSIYNLNKINCIPVKNFATKDDLKGFAHFDDINAGYNVYIRRHYPEITISSYPTGQEGQIQFAKSGYPSEPNIRFGASHDLFWDDQHSRLGIKTQSPRDALDVHGALYVSEGIAQGSNGYTMAWRDPSGFLSLQGGGPTEGRVYFTDIGVSVESSDRSGSFGSPQTIQLAARNLGANSTYIRVSSEHWIDFWTEDLPRATINEDGISVVSGGIAVHNLPTHDPGPGSKKLWADPSDGYRVKWAH